MAPESRRSVLRTLKRVRSGDASASSTFGTFFDDSTHGPLFVSTGGLGLVGALGVLDLGAPLLASAALVLAAGLGMLTHFKLWRRAQRDVVVLTPTVHGLVNSSLGVLERLDALEWSPEAGALEAPVLEVLMGLVEVGPVLRSAGSDASVEAHHAELKATVKDLETAITALEEAAASRHHALVVKRDLEAGAHRVHDLRGVAARAASDAATARDLEASALSEVLAAGAAGPAHSGLVVRAASAAEPARADPLR
jgi:hypothetical protein